MRVGWIGVAIGMLIAWGLMLLAIVAQFEGDLSIVWNQLAALLIWLVLFAAIIIALAGYLAK